MQRKRTREPYRLGKQIMRLKEESKRDLLQNISVIFGERVGGYQRGSDNLRFESTAMLCFCEAVS